MQLQKHENINYNTNTKSCENNEVFWISIVLREN